MVSYDGTVKLLDFGIAKALHDAGDHRTMTGTLKGKLGYMSPEQITGKELDGRTDIFSAGVLMWEMLAGTRLFPGKNEIEVIDKVRGAEIVPPSHHNPNCPIELDEVVLRALERRAEDRWRHGSDMRVGLDEVRRYYGQHATPFGVTRWKRKLRRDTSARFASESGELTAVRQQSAETEQLLEDVDIVEIAENLEPAPIDPHSQFHEVTEDEIEIQVFYNEDATT
jgi:serine/threonine-protein kinase